MSEIKSGHILAQGRLSGHSPLQASVSPSVNERVVPEIISVIPFGYNIPGFYDSTDTTGSVVLNQWFSTGGNSAAPPPLPRPQGTLGANVWRHFGCHKWRGVLLGVKGWEPGTIPNTPQGPGCYDLAPNVFRSEMDKSRFNP